MQWETLRAIVGPYNMTAARAQQLTPGLNQALLAAGCTTVARAAMFIAQTCEESANYHASEEYASGAEYDGRADLGNTHPGDGPRYKGRSFIQITGRNNYHAISEWLYHRGLCSTPTYFLDHPEKLADDKYVWLGPVFYWAGDHNHGYSSINAAADAHDIQAATEMVNGGLNGFDTRNHIWQTALSHGPAILPEVAPSMGQTVALIRAMMLGGKYATPKLIAKYGKLVNNQGLFNLVAELEAVIENLNKQVANLNNEVARLKRDQANTTPTPVSAPATAPKTN